MNVIPERIIFVSRGITVIHDHAISQFNMVMKTTNAHKRLLYYTHNWPPTCFSHTCGHPQGKGHITKLFEPMHKMKYTKF